MADRSPPPESAGAPSLNDGPRHVLVVENEDPLRRAFARALRRVGHRVTEAANGQDALKLLARDDFDAIVSDIGMPGLDGISLLRAVRQQDLDVPVIIVTGSPTVETATQALEYGALRYLTKPFPLGVLVDAVVGAIKFGHIARLKREAVDYLGVQEKQLGDRSSLETRFENALESLWMAYQPLVDPRRGTIVAYEALLRSSEPTLKDPGAVLSVAERLGRVHDLGRAIRTRIANDLSVQHPGTDLYINLHANDLLDDKLFDQKSALAAFASGIVLEITERSSLANGVNVLERIRRLREVGYRIAIDDLGAGYAGLSYFALLAPDVVKLDISLVRNVDREPVKHKIIGSMTTLCRDLGMIVVAEGIETAGERDAIVELGCDLLQGYLFARPGPPFPVVDWSNPAVHGSPIASTSV